MFVVESRPDVTVLLDLAYKTNKLFTYLHVVEAAYLKINK